MKEIAGYATAAIVLALLGAGCLGAGLLDREIARTQRDFAALDYDEPEATFERLERYLTYARWLPWVGREPLDDLRARRAAMRYWTRHYELLTPEQSDLVETGSADNPQLQLIAANAVYRKNQAAAKNQAATLKALDAAIAAYLSVLKNTEWREAAAYNYEYVTRTREDVEKGRRTPELTETADDGPAGRKGGPPPTPSQQKFKILIPLEPGEMDKATEPGKGTPIERKG